MVCGEAQVKKTCAIHGWGRIKAKVKKTCTIWGLATFKGN